MSQLFFFDGEKIREIADGEDDNEQLAQAIRGLLGIDLVDRLTTDIGLYLARHQRGSETEVAERLETVVRDIAIAERRAEALADEVAEITSARESQARAAEQIRRRFVSEGGDAAMRRARTEADRDETRRQIAKAEHELRDLANRLLPFALAPHLLAAFTTELTRATGDTVRSGPATDLRGALRTWAAAKDTGREASWTDQHWADLSRFLSEWENSDGRTGAIPAFREVGDGTAALARLNEVEAVTRPRARALLADFDNLNSRAAELDHALKRADDAAAGMLLDELRLAEQRVGATEVTLKARQDELKGVRGELVTLERERRRLLEEQARSAAANERAALAARTAQAVAAYERQLLQHKLSRLRTEFIQRFNHLARKPDLIADVRINPATFATTLIGRDGAEVPKGDLSAGEKQVYAIALLWALARTSGRPLPMIIDTPLARLDSEHRSNLVTRYFPSASHQVVLLSTDTEVDDGLLAELGRNVSHAYRLDYDSRANRTVASPGYFEAVSLGERRRALQQA